LTESVATARDFSFDDAFADNEAGVEALLRGTFNDLRFKDNFLAFADSTPGVDLLEDFGEGDRIGLAFTSAEVATAANDFLGDFTFSLGVETAVSLL